MGKQVIITESDKQRILSLYGLINEETTTSIVGKVVSNYVMSAGFVNYNESKNPIEGVEVILSTIENGYLIKKQNTTKTNPQQPTTNWVALRRNTDDKVVVATRRAAEVLELWG